VLKVKQNEDEEPKEKKEKQPFERIYFADFETFTKNENKDDIQHDPFLLCYNYFSTMENKLNPV
jgi:hypothetical protein